MNQTRVLRDQFIGMVIDDDPVGFVEARFKTEIGDPRGFLAQLTLLPGLIVVRLQPYIGAEEMPGQSLQQNTGKKTVEIALVSQNHIWLGQRTHRTPHYALPSKNSKHQKRFGDPDFDARAVLLSRRARVRRQVRQE